MLLLKYVITLQWVTNSRD